MFFLTAPVSQYVLNEGANNRLHSMDSVLVDIENVVIMWWALQPITMAYLKPGQQDLFLNVLGNQSSHFDQLNFWPASAGYKLWCRDRPILYNIPVLKLV